MAFEKSNHKPVYRQIYDTLTSELNKGLYDEKGMLPSEKELCARFGVERNTVRKSLQLLVEENRVIRRPGLGTELVKPKEGRKPRAIRCCLLPRWITSIPARARVFTIN